ncbi:MAG: triose-phosphate isomerase [Hyphomicrobiaceae bacterium]
MRSTLELGRSDELLIEVNVIKPLVAGNWKMNGLRAAAGEAAKIRDALTSSPIDVDVLICPPATLLPVLAVGLQDSAIDVGGQDCHTEVQGAHTGDLSAEMLQDAGASAVIVGHSERRADHGELSALVHDKAQAAHRGGLTAIICVGETAGERAAGLTLPVVERQLRASVPRTSSAQNTVIAYEPVWAIGTGLTPTTGDVAAVHAAIRELLVAEFNDGAAFRILYGGSVKPDNAADLMSIANVDGALVGGASLKADDFLGVIRACQQVASQV